MWESSFSKRFIFTPKFVITDFSYGAKEERSAEGVQRVKLGINSIASILLLLSYKNFSDVLISPRQSRRR